jgi:hypothetical protein
MGNGKGNGNGDGVGNNNRDGDGNCNGHGHGKGDDEEGRVASSCAGDVQPYGRGNTLPPPPWTQRKVHSPAAIGRWVYQAKKEEEEQINVALFVNEN